MKQTDSKLRVGVEVRFLNSTGGGRVVRITGDTAWVEDPDGFEIPTPLRECVVVESGDTFMPAYKPPKLSSSTSYRAVDDKESQMSQENHENTHTISESSLSLAKPQTFLPASGSVSAYLAFLPLDETKLGSTPYEAFLINDSKYILFYTYSNRQGNKWQLRSSGYIEPDSQFFLEEFAPHDVNDLELLNIQIIAFAEKPKVYQGTYSVELRLDVKKFFKLNTYEENDFFEDSAWIEPLVEDDQTRVVAKRVNAQQIAQSMQSANTPKNKVEPVASKEKVIPNDPNETLVVDLHIQMLLDDTTGMNQATIFRYQVDKFNEVMQANLKYKGKKIVFIHGKGNGVLRNKIEGELRYRYPGCSYQDASFSEYSYGATQVTIGEKKNKQQKL